MKVLKSLAMVTVVTTMFSCGNQKADVSSLETEIDSASYALGMDMAIKVKANFDDSSTDLFVQGYRNGMDSTNLLIEQKDLNDFLRVFFQKQQADKMKVSQEKAAADALLKYADVKKESEEFLMVNKTEEGVMTTASGLQYKVLEEGTGAMPVATSKIKINYHGTLIDGTVFDSTIEKKTPYESNANQFIPGFTEGLLLMKEGAKYKFFIPQNLAYGATPRPGQIKPFATIVFEVELLEILKQ
ncbi:MULTISPECIES: FKBP-type peptidyl-prolyl cis-trans isomerase [unclassified Polaribacter]|uniref:FKBP-type peptidyl-prolyl cis-trans isomerase n=1 Tax=unclassified Polaribacter TaxID=196858 RepID=UPI0011BEADBF|nr:MULTISPECIES: FKBP-type peptidyl-prolyl cis-trans isomerase [unclassified Polaribacter]TXD49600.1 FKBP-type peptidyl-prolyl cis-trans isomerase [Polaribacter sp. IC063]TXD59080.1 FKBP-type peptidyl-prolyl cis-trans isomerase [Polaribacter sp. IC066]